MLWMFVAARVLVNPLSNVFQKLLTRDGVSPLGVIGGTHALMSVVCLPLLVVAPPTGSLEFWGSIALCAVLAIASNVLLVMALEKSDLSVLGPINSYKAVVSMIPGVVLLGEVPTWPALAGVVLIVVGSYFLTDRDAAETHSGAYRKLFTDRGVQYRVAALVLAAIEAVFLKRALLASSVLATFAVWAVLGLVVVLPMAGGLRAKHNLGAKNGPNAERNWPGVLPSFVLLALTTGLMQLSTIVVLGGFQVAAALALFQMSTLVSVLLGWRVFREPHIVKRLVGSAIMTGGAILIVTTR